MITIQVFCLTCTSEATPPRSVFLRRLPVSVFVPNDSLAVTSCACADPDGEESPWGEGGGGGDVGAIRGRILASLSYLQRLSATPYPQSSVLQQREAGFKMKTPQLSPENRCANQPEVTGRRVTRAHKTPLH